MTIQETIAELDQACLELKGRNDGVVYFRGSSAVALLEYVRALEAVALYSRDYTESGTMGDSLLRRALAALDGLQEAQRWDDEEKDQWTAEIEAAFPTRSGAHEAYADAMRMVGNRRSKGALVALVTWLIVRFDAKHAKLVEVADKLREIRSYATRLERIVRVARRALRYPRWKSEISYIKTIARARRVLDMGSR